MFKDSAAAASSTSDEARRYLWLVVHRRFLDSTAAYVVSEALKLVFNKDGEFKEWLESQAANDKKSAALEASLTGESAKEPSVPMVCPPKANGNGLFR